MIKANCHCGMVAIEFAIIPKQYTECNCSICRRYAVQWLYGLSSEMEVVSGKEAIKNYTWGDHEIAFCHCRYCGVVTHYQALPKTSSSRVALNGRLLDPAVLSSLDKREFDGAAM